MRKRGFLAGLVAGLAALTAVLTMASPVMADYPTVDASQAGSLTIENYPVKGAQFRAYEVASFSGGKLVLTDGFRDAKITGPDTVRVWAADAKNPTAVRYNWGCQGFGNLYNAAGLPASCFTTED